MPFSSLEAIHTNTWARSISAAKARKILSVHSEVTDLKWRETPATLVRAAYPRASFLESAVDNARRLNSEMCMRACALVSACARMCGR
eukprot:6175684-Pleurochrysis_carterae.AAC.1